MISSSLSLSINIKSRVPVLLLEILNGASKSYTISWLYQHLSSRVLNEFRDFAVTTDFLWAWARGTTVTMAGLGFWLAMGLVVLFA